ncbi:MAG: hypothetical protein AAF446_04325 [Pseudomonadota bacterium]
MIPLHRLLVPMWPMAIEEQYHSDGSMQLRQAKASNLNENRLRSRPLSAARLDMHNGQRVLGYVVAMRAEGLSTNESAVDPVANLNLPDYPIWQPHTITAAEAACKLALSQPGEPPMWLSCDSVHRVVLPNRLTLMQKFEVALARLADAPSPQAIESEAQFNGLRMPSEE